MKKKARYEMIRLKLTTNSKGPFSASLNMFVSFGDNVESLFDNS